MTLRQMRESRTLTQEQVAAETGLDQTTISQIENGRVRDPRYSTLVALASVYRVSVEEIASAIAAEAAA